MIGMSRRFLRLLTRRQVAGPAWWSVVSRLPVYLMSLAMVLVVREQGGSYPQAGMVSAFYTVGMALGSPLVARRIDRTGRRGVLLTTGLVYPLALAALVWGTAPGAPGQLALAVIAGVSLPPANACMRSLWARLPLRDEERETAYLWEALLTELLVIGTPLMLAALMVTGSAGRALTAVAVLGGIGALGLALTPLPREVADKDRAARAERGARRGGAGPLRDPHAGADGGHGRLGRADRPDDAGHSGLRRPARHPGAHRRRLRLLGRRQRAGRPVAGARPVGAAGAPALPLAAAGVRGRYRTAAARRLRTHPGAGAGDRRRAHRRWCRPARCPWSARWRTAGC